jgi:Inositol hexakisphosphate
MKEDIISEVSQSGGQMLLHREVINTAANQSSVIGYWEDISPDNVKTPSEVFAGLKEEGFNIEYKRIPLTREREAVASDIEAIHSCLLGYALASLFRYCVFLNL